MLRFLSIFLVSSCMLLLSTIALFGQDTPEDSSSIDEDLYKFHILGAPYISGDTDLGLTVGFASNLSQADRINLIIIGEYATRGYLRFGTRGEVTVFGTRLGREIKLARYYRSIYEEDVVTPEKVYRAITNVVKIHLSPLFTTRRGMEIGPEVYVMVATSDEQIEDPDGNRVYGVRFPEYMDGGIAHTGVRFRWRTTSPIRPTHGSLFETALRGGIAFGEEWDEVRPDAAFEVMLARAQPIVPRVRLYARTSAMFSANTPTSVRDFVGGQRTVRGQPLERYYARRILTGRAQLHLLTLDRWMLPARIAEKIWDKLPALPLDIETVLFYDVGAAGDPEYGWRKTRHSIGIGLRFIIPPEMVFNFDIALSPGGELFYYFGGGETL